MSRRYGSGFTKVSGRSREWPRRQVWAKKPLTAPLQLTRNKLRRLADFPASLAATLPATMEHWANCERNLARLSHTDNLAITLLTVDVPGLPCPYCGIYFRHTKAMRQHTARKHGVKWRSRCKLLTTLRFMRWTACPNAVTAAKDVAPIRG